ncbi:hypothetical protein [Telmatospirillum sp. J64-1]|uniref:hypothetical protein n=1 Tax=Telmatospirillum sp. J64-1 TaxID=2502183 RepID=UPI002102470F|nr:hypothetical protein [Telmatospirillum sp. J64-1]
MRLLYTDAMPIRRAHRFLYPIDWPQLSKVIRFHRAKGRCEQCGRPHGQEILSLVGDGRWQCPSTGMWRNGEGKRTRRPTSEEMTDAKTWRVMLATAHLDHDPGNNSAENLKALCQRCHMIHDRDHNAAMRRLAMRRRRALGDLFEGPYPLL